ncbi:MAG TPA: hypothetical protein VHM30_17915, partial [Gemmatimonadaceae bacterium]|nr:hypothetical protein [Gemmatimonadaceae bacterium]
MAARREARMVSGAKVLATAALVMAAGIVEAQETTPGVSARGDSVSVRLVDADLRSVVQVLSKYLDRPVVFGNVGAVRVTIETPRPVPTSEIPRLLRGTIESQGYELFADSAAAMYRVRQRDAQRPAQADTPLSQGAGPEGMRLFVIRLHHARAVDVAATVNALYGKAA